jgi:hypothetical protein
VLYWASLSTGSLRKRDPKPLYFRLCLAQGALLTSADDRMLRLIEAFYDAALDQALWPAGLKKIDGVVSYAN